jgi:hypothetical protein
VIRVTDIGSDAYTDPNNMAPSAAEEAAFMAQLLQGLDDTFSSPCKPIPQSKLRTPSKPSTPKSNHDLDMSTFLEGSENWLLDDLTLSPIKPTTGSPTSNVCCHDE